jgi:hypothetical protein
MRKTLRLIGMSGTLLAFAAAPVVPVAAADDRAGGDSEPRPIVITSDNTGGGDSEPKPIVTSSDDRAGGDSEPHPIAT